MSTKKVGIILSGCGFKDGSEIHEAVLTIYFLDKHGAEILCMAPNKPQASVIDHSTGKASEERRNILNEAARIARGQIKDIKSVSAKDIDAVILPGGYGAAKNLCTFADDGPNCQVDPDVSRLLKELHAKGKPIGALCIAPALVAKLFGADHHVELTIGNDPGTAQALEKMGAKHKNTPVTEIAFDAKNKIVTTPCYMYDAGVSEIGVGAEKLVKKILEIA